jgi:hypothetical protein
MKCLVSSQASSIPTAVVLVLIAIHLLSTMREHLPTPEVITHVENEHNAWVLECLSCKGCDLKPMLSHCQQMLEIF